MTFFFTVPAVTLVDVTTSITSSREPFSLVVGWSVYDVTSLQQSDHVGFIVSCFDNSTGKPNYVLLRHLVLNNQLTISYSENVLLTASCVGQLTSYQCAVSPFNERGEGQTATSEYFSLPCTGGGV